jgi:hypothetical protein
MSAPPEPPIDPAVAQQVIDLIAKLAHVTAWQSGTGGLECAGGIISYLHANPEHTAHVIGGGSLLDLMNIFDMQYGSLTWHASNGKIVSPKQLREELRRVGNPRAIGPDS